jgi:hypothetical protein
MSKVFSNAQTGVRTYLDESAQIDFLDTEIASAINQAYHDVIGHVIEVYENYYNTTTPFTYAMVANQQEYTIDPSLIKVTRVEINYKPSDPNTQALRAVPVQTDELRLNLANSNAAGSYFNAGYYLHGNVGSQKIGFVPIPQESDTTGHSISVWGVAMPLDLSTGTDNINIPYADRYIYLINLRAAAILLRKGQQEEATATRYMLEYEAGIKEMQTFLFERQADDVRMIEDAELEDIDFSVITNL